MMMKIVLLSLAVRRLPPCLSCSYDFGPNLPGDGDDGNEGDEDGENDDHHDDVGPDNITLILLIVAESPSGLLLRLAASTRSSSGSGSISTIGLLLRP